MLYQYVRNALGLLATGEDKLSQAQQLLLGTLTIGASDTVTGQFLTPYLDEFHHQHPGIRLKIVSGRSAKVVSKMCIRDRYRAATVEKQSMGLSKRLVPL